MKLETKYFVATALSRAVNMLVCACGWGGLAGGSAGRREAEGESSKKIST